MAYLSQKSGKWTLWIGWFIERVDPSTGEKTVMAEKPGVDFMVPDFSPDGPWIAFQASPSAGVMTMQLFVAALDARLPLGPDRIVIGLGRVQSDLWMMQLPER